MNWVSTKWLSVTSEIAKHIELSIIQTKEYLYRLVRAITLQTLGDNRNKKYSMK